MGAGVGVEKHSVAIRSPVSWAVLGLVMQRPSYGYELVQRFERTYGDSLELSSPSQIYVSLDGLKRKGMIEEIPAEEAEPDVVRQPKPHYKATAAGVSAYRKWLVSLAREQRKRARLFAKQVSVLTAEDALSVLEHCELAYLDEACGRPPKTAKSLAEKIEGLEHRLQWEEDRLAVGAMLSWIDYARGELRQLVAAHRAKRGGGKP